MLKPRLHFFVFSPLSFSVPIFWRQLSFSAPLPSPLSPLIPIPWRPGMPQLSPAQCGSPFPLPASLAGSSAGHSDPGQGLSHTASSHTQLWVCFSPWFRVCLFCCSAAIPSAECSDSRSWSLPHPTAPQLQPQRLWVGISNKTHFKTAFWAAPDETSESTAKMPLHTDALSFSFSIFQILYCIRV